MRTSGINSANFKKFLIQSKYSIFFFFCRCGGARCFHRLFCHKHPHFIFLISYGFHMGVCKPQTAPQLIASVPSEIKAEIDLWGSHHDFKVRLALVRGILGLQSESSHSFWNETETILIQKSHKYIMNNTVIRREDFLFFENLDSSRLPKYTL